MRRGRRPLYRSSLHLPDRQLGAAGCAAACGQFAVLPHQSTGGAGKRLLVAASLRRWPPPPHVGRGPGRVASSSGRCSTPVHQSVVLPRALASCSLPAHTAACRQGPGLAAAHQWCSTTAVHLWCFQQHACCSPTYGTAHTSFPLLGWGRQAMLRTGCLPLPSSVQRFQPARRPCWECNWLKLCSGCPHWCLQQQHHGQTPCTAVRGVGMQQQA
jgi:hypothetical protein